MEHPFIPPEKTEAVTRALQKAFGVSEFEDICKLLGGLTSCLVFRIVVRGTPYLLRLIMRPDDPARHYSNMRAAADAGIAPRVRYTSVPDKLAITDFVNAVPFPPSEALVRMPALLRTLHALPRFAPVPPQINTSCIFLLHPGPARDGFLRTLHSANLVPEDERTEAFARFEQIAATYPLDDANMVSSHNDLKPENILFDGDRAWLVDWEAAMLNDRYADLACVANYITTNDAEERVYLETYFGHAPDDYQLARFHVMQQVAHLFFAMGYLLFGARGKPLSHTEPAPEFRGFLRRMWAGEIDMEDDQMKIAYGRTHWARLLHNLRQPRLDEALRIVGDRHPQAQASPSTT
jgi:aminoglycoside phosphotransferase (APT) family kinase protein